jgi:hypothetical protein
MAVINTNLVCDLQTAVKVQYLDGNIFSQDNQGNVINVTVLDGGEPATITGTISANIIRADGGTVAATGGTITDNVASITLPAAAYAVPGVVSIVIKNTNSSVVTTIAAIVANVYQSSTDTVVDPGTIIPSIQTLISSIETAVASIPADYSSLWTSLAPAFSSSASYVAGQYVTYNGGLYRFTTTHSGSWSSSDAVSVNIGGDLSDLKSALCDVANDLFDTNSVMMDGYSLVIPPWWERGTIDNNGADQSSDTAWRGHGYIPVSVGQKIISKCINYNSLKFRCYNSSFVFNGSTIGTNNSSGTKTETLTIPTNTAYIRPIIQRTDSNYEMSPQNVKAYTLWHDTQIPMFYAKLVSNVTDAFNIDTVLSKITFASSAFIFFKTTRYQISANTEYSYADITGSSKYFVYDYKNNLCKFIAFGSYDPRQYAVIFAINTNGNGMDFCTYFGRYTVNGGMRDFCDIAFVNASTGNDRTGNIGSRSQAFKTISAALAVSNIVHVYPGTYNEKITSTDNRNEIQIIAEGQNTTSDNRIILNFGTDVECTVSGGYSTASYTAESGSLMYKCFVAKSESVEVDDGSTNKGYKCNLWNGETKLIPVMSLDDCQATENTWFYDGTTITAHCEAETLILADGEVDNGITISNCSKVVLKNIDILYARESSCYINNARTIDIDNCSFCYSGVYNGLRIVGCSGDITECLAKYNRMDGLNIHGEGSTRFINCRSFHNYDDGISHHEKSNGYILGGEYAYNGKGGVCSPTWGCKVDTNGAYIHHNQNGFYALSDETGSEATNPMSTVSNCLITYNHFGIRSRRYPIIGWNNILENNDTNTWAQNDGTIELH